MNFLKTPSRLSSLYLLAYLLITLMAVAPHPSFAQGGVGATGGNGGGGELLFHALTVRVSNWLEENLNNGSLTEKLHLNEAGISAQDLVQRHQKAIKAAHVKFIPQDRLKSECKQGDRVACQLQETSRICINTLTPISVIECNEDRFLAKAPDFQFAINFHEYLGIAEIETNDAADYSQYPISKYLLVLSTTSTSSSDPSPLEKNCFNDHTTTLEEIFSHTTHSPPEDTLTLRCMEGRRTYTQSQKTHQFFEIHKISDYLHRHSDLALVIQKDELNRFCQHVSYAMGLIDFDPSSRIEVAPHHLPQVREKLKSKSILWYFEAKTQSIYSITHLTCQHQETLN